jgi:hypothetical protein
MRLTNLWSWLTGPKSGQAQRLAQSRFARRFVPEVRNLEARDVPNGYMAIGAGPGNLPLVAIRVDIQDALGGSAPNSAGQPATPRSDGQTDFTSQVLMAYDPSFRGGVNVATGNFDGNYNTPDMLVTAPKAGGGPHVIVWNTAQRTDGTIVVTGIRAQFMAFDPRFTGGVNITTGDLDGDGKAELICAAGPGGGPHVRIYTTDAAGNFVLATQFFAYGGGFTGGVSVASNQGYDTPTQIEQVIDTNTFATTPYAPGDTVPGQALGIPQRGLNINPLTGAIQPYVTVGSGFIQYLSGNLLNSYNQIAYRPDISGSFDPTVGRLVLANWADTTPTSNYPTDGSNPPTGVAVGPYVQVGTINVGGTVTPVVTRLTEGPGQVTPRNQLVTGAGPGGGPDVRVWSFTGSGTNLQVSLQKDFFAFDPHFTGGINVSIGSVISNPSPDLTSGTVVPLGLDGLPETTGNSGTLGTPPFPQSGDVLRRYGSQITVAMASGGSLVRIFSDFNPDVADPFSLVAGATAPSLRTSVSQTQLTFTQIDTSLGVDVNNPLGGFTNFFPSVNFSRAIDPQFTGGVVPTVAAFTFDGSANDVVVGFNAFSGGLGFIRNPVLGQSVFGVGTGAANPSRGSQVNIFNQMSELTQLDASYNPIDSFSAFSPFSGVGVSLSYGFGVLPTPTLDTVQLSPNAPVMVPTVTNPILI